MQPYLVELAMVVVIHMLAVMSPGPDFAIIVRQSVGYGRVPALWSSLGIGVGILVHVTYSLFGIGLLLAQSRWLFNVLQYLGAAYMLYLAWDCLRAVPHNSQQVSNINNSQSSWVSFRIGLFTNLLNPKATVFFISLFSLVISPLTPVKVQVLYGLIMVILTSIWFALVATLLTKASIKMAYRRFSHWLERTMGIFLVAVAVRLFYNAMVE
jgi:RhtB (resistance to homoserine/threonine) family protein